MLINLFQTVRASGVPCSLRELLDLLGALEKQLVYASIDDFYYLSRAILVKDEKHYDKFDKAFDIYFKGIEKLEDIFQALIPEAWLRKAFETELDPEELKKIKSYLSGLSNALFARMSGSGSSIVAYFHSKKACKKACSQYKRKFNSNWCIESKTI